ncbi:hypothetical protein [Pseudonocardia lacus]|uniref:hypothetical protein n=1 Tax=Pseudonocardia lacus TaxID=2835865 RepID=UPI001BDC87B7|nr:hypothetical protein [Pseudonocardia lacus]
MDYATVRQAFFGRAPTPSVTPEVVVSGSPARRLRDALEPLAMHAVWSPGTDAALAELIEQGLPGVDRPLRGQRGRSEGVLAAPRGFCGGGWVLAARRRAVTPHPTLQHPPVVCGTGPRA